MRTFCALVRCCSAVLIPMIVVCEGKEHVPPLVKAVAWPEIVLGLDDCYEIDQPGAYRLQADPAAGVG